MIKVKVITAILLVAVLISGMGLMAGCACGFETGGNDDAGDGDNIPFEAFITYSIGENNMGISGYDEAITGDTFTIPSEVNGKTVIAIDKYAFSDDFKGKGEHVTTINIPSTITLIDDGAFMNCASIQKVNLQGNSQLQHINYKAFAGCSELTTIAGGTASDVFLLPDRVEYLGEYAFYGTGFTSIDISSSVTTIGDGALSGCPNLSTIRVASSNTKYCAESGVLYNKDRTKLFAYPTEMTGASFNVPITVATIGESAFAGNPYLTQVNLNNVKDIGASAFTMAYNLSSVCGSYVEMANFADFNGTVWFDSNKNNTVYLGKTLLSYKGNTANLILSDIVSIGSYAFNGNKTLSSLILPEEMIHTGAFAFFDCTSLQKVVYNSTESGYISDYAFKGCVSLREIYFVATYAMISKNNAFDINPDLKIYVKSRFLYHYIDNNSDWDNYKNNFATKSMMVILQSKGNTYSTLNTTWGTLISLPSEEIMEAYNIDNNLYDDDRLDHWQEGSSFYFGDGYMDTLSDTVTLTACYVAKD